MKSYKKQHVIDRFWKKFDRPKKGCWEWKGSTGSAGYGRISFGHGETNYRTNYTAHRLSWMLFFGPIPDGICVLHRCDNPKCVRPDHLFLGTHTDNMKDRDRKNRTQQGEKHYRAKLTEEDVILIINMYHDGAYTLTELSKHFNITKEAIRQIVNNITWKGVYSRYIDNDVPRKK